jgi:disulfide bond formation protein DsbB
MPAYLETFNQFLSFGAIALQVAVLVIGVNLLLFRSRTNVVLVFFKKYTFYLGFAVAVSSVALSLFYSDVIGFPPCELCWIQRIFLYPQAILFSMELYKRDRAIVDYSIVLAICGALASLFHIYVEQGGASSLSCATGGPDVVSCATIYVSEFSYVTIPVMALSAAAFILLLLINYKYMTRTKVRE